MSSWIDPRTNPTPPWQGPERRLADDDGELADLMAACKAGRIYDVEAWIASGRALQMDVRGHRRRKTALGVAIAAGHFDLVRLLLCNGYRSELEPESPLDAALENRRTDLVYLMLDWGVDPHGADPGRILDTYQREIFERFWEAGVDLTARGAMADAFANSTRNLPLYGFAKNCRVRDPRIERALAGGLSDAIEEGNAKAVSLCLWAGADPRLRVADVADPEDGEDEAEGPTAIEQAVAQGRHELLPKLGFDPDRDDLDALHGEARDVGALRALVAIRPPSNWDRIALAFLHRLAISVRLSIRWVSVGDVEQVFALGARFIESPGTLAR